MGTFTHRWLSHRSTTFLSLPPPPPPCAFLGLTSPYRHSTASARQLCLTRSSPSICGGFLSCQLPHLLLLATSSAMGRLKKHSSKRTSLRTKYKIQKKVKEYKKKQKKLTKKNPHKLYSHTTPHKPSPLPPTPPHPTSFPSHLPHAPLLPPSVETRRDPGIPNAWPFKQQLLAEIAVQHGTQQAADAARRVAKRERQEAKSNPATIHDPTVLPASISSVTTAPVNTFALHTRQTLRILRQLIETSDLLLFALDARDPQGSRWLAMEEKLSVTAKAPPLLFVLTHCDLIPSSVLSHWLIHLNQSHPTLAFITDHSLDAPTSKPLVTITTPLPRPTTDVLIDLIRGYRVEGKERARVAVMGFENVGKSSVANAVMRQHLCGVSELGGYTKDVRVLHVNDHVDLMDSPGIPSTPSHPGPHISLPLDQAKDTSQPSFTQRHSREERDSTTCTS